MCTKPVWLSSKSTKAPKLVIPETLPETFAPTSIDMKLIDPPQATIL